MWFRKSVHVAQLETTINEDDFIITNKNKVSCIVNMHKQGRNAFLSGHFFKKEGFGKFRNFDADCSSYPNFLATHVHSNNDVEKEFVKTNNISHCKADDIKDLACVFHLDSIERNECTVKESKRREKVVVPFKNFFLLIILTFVASSFVIVWLIWRSPLGDKCSLVEITQKSQ